jgi:predicted transposase YbfD/YdcC
MLVVDTLLDSLDLSGTLVTEGAMHTQPWFAQDVVPETHADYRWIAKGSPPTLEADSLALDWDDFSPPSETWANGHGWIEHRRICTSTVSRRSPHFST